MKKKKKYKNEWIFRKILLNINPYARMPPYVCHFDTIDWFLGFIYTTKDGKEYCRIIMNVLTINSNLKNHKYILNVTHTHTHAPKFTLGTFYTNSIFCVMHFYKIFCSIFYSNGISHCSYKRSIDW